MTRTAVLAVLPVLCVIGAAWIASGQETPRTRRAVAALQPRSGSTASGEAIFETRGRRVTMTIKMIGLTPGTHAIHLHEKGDCSDPEANSAGPHWNPKGSQHGRWGGGSFHHGDIGNLEASADGRAVLRFSTDLWTVGGDSKTDIVGRAVVVHEKADDFHTQPAGNAGARVACGVIRAGE